MAFFTGNRFAEALALQDASNISGVARTLVEIIDNARANPFQGNAARDAAVQLTVYKLAALAGFEPLGWEGYDHANKVCEACAALGANAASGL